MENRIYDEKNGLWYAKQGDYYLPELALPPEEEKPIGIWGQRHKRYLKEHGKATYTTLLTSGKLNTYLADINEQAQERFERLIGQMKQAQGITEQLKAKNALEWVGRLNNIRVCAMEIVEKGIIFAQHTGGREKSLPPIDFLCSSEYNKSSDAKQLIQKKGGTSYAAKSKIHKRGNY